jgi:hypothetical protein
MDDVLGLQLEVLGDHAAGDSLAVAVWPVIGPAAAN